MLRVGLQTVDIEYFQLSKICMWWLKFFIVMFITFYGICKYTISNATYSKFYLWKWIFVVKLETVDLIKLEKFQPEVDIAISVNRPLLEGSQVDMNNLMTITAESLFAPPETWALTGMQYAYAVALPVPQNNEVFILHYKEGGENHIWKSFVIARSCGCKNEILLTI